MKYNQRARQIDFKIAQKVWFYNPQRFKGKTPKLQSNWENLYEIVKKISDVVYYIQKSQKHKKKIVHADRLANFHEREIRKGNKKM